MNIAVTESIVPARAAPRAARVNTAVLFKDVPIGSVFRALRNEFVGPKNAQRVVNNNSMYAKTGHNASVDIGHGNVDVVFGMEMPCRIVTGVLHINITQLESYKLCHKGQPA